MPIPNWLKIYLLVQVPDVNDPDVLAMASLYVRAAGTGMVEFFTKVLPLFTTERPFAKNTEGAGQRWAPLMDNAAELATADTLIQAQLASADTTSAFGTPLNAVQVILLGLADGLGPQTPIAPAEYKHDDIGLIKVGTLFDTPEAMAVTNARLAEWVSTFGADRFTATGHTVDGNGDPVLLSTADARSWLETETTAQKLRTRSGAPLWGVA